MEYLNFHRVLEKVIVLALAGFIFSCSTEEFEPEVTKEWHLTTPTTNPVKNKQIKDQYIVLLSKKPVREDKRAESALEALTREVRNMPNAKIKGVYKSALTGFVAKLNQSQLDKLRSDSRVISVTADRYLELENSEDGIVAVQDYPVYGLDKIDQRDELMDRAYSYTSSGSGVTAYIIDSGIRSSHSEFNNRVSLGFDFVLAYPDENDVLDPSLEPGEDCHGHGTHVAGTVGGSTYGVAKDVDLVNLRVFGCTDGSPWSRIILAIDWVTEIAQKPAVVNMSLGAPVEDIEDLADIAVQNSIATGVTYAIAGGNSSMDACEFSPARVPEALTVGASNIENDMATWSNYGNCLDLFAPGVFILSAGIADDTSTRYMTGTSMAAPHVAGIAALYLSENPEATPAEVHQVVKDNSTPAIINNVPSGPTNLAYSHWGAVGFTAPQQPNLDLNAHLSKIRGAYQVELTWKPVENQESFIGGSNIIYRDGTIIGEHDISVSSMVDDLGKVRDGTYVYKVCGSLYKNCSEKTIIIGDGGESTEPENSPPSADFSFSTNLLDVQFTDTSTDSDGSIISWSWNLGDGNSSAVQHPEHSYLQAGTYEVSLVVTDDFGDSHDITKSVSVTEEISNPESLELSAIGSKVKGQWQTDLSWTPAGGDSQIDIYRNGSLIVTTNNTGSYTDATSFKGGGSLEYKVCESDTNNCSNTVMVQF